jgi:hypothetical protein
MRLFGRRYFISIDIALFGFLLTVLLQWVILREIAGFLIRPFHIMIFLLLISLLFDKNLLIYTRDLLKTGYYFFTLVFCFFLMEIFSLFWAKNMLSGVTIALKQFMYILMSFSLAIKVANIQSIKTVRTIFWGCLLGVIVFF